MPCAQDGNASNHEACSAPTPYSMPLPPALGPWRTFSQGFLNTWQGRGQGCFIELTS